MADDTSGLTEDQFIKERRKLGPLPPWWRWLARRRWYAAEYRLYQRHEQWLRILQAILDDIKSGP